MFVALVRSMFSKHWALQELEARIRLDASAARQEILQMCEGMKRITLPVSTNADVRHPSACVCFHSGLSFWLSAVTRRQMHLSPARFV